MSEKHSDFERLYRNIDFQSDQKVGIFGLTKQLPIFGLAFVISILFQVSAWGGERKPCNYAADEDLIVVPETYRPLNFVEKINKEREGEFTRTRNQVQLWQHNQELAEAYGITNSTQMRVSTMTQRQNMIESRYLRFFSQAIERNNNEMVNNWYESWTADDEVDSIEDLNKFDNYVVLSEKTRIKNASAKQGQSANTKKNSNKFEFDIQPRVEVGSMRIRIKTPFFKMRAWVGVNGQQEVSLERRFKMTGTRALVNYYVDDDRALAAVDQPLMQGLKLRITHSKFNVSGEDRLPASSVQPEVNTVQLKYGLNF
jgi:hypothetical protein